MTMDELRTHLETDADDALLAAKLRGFELLIRAYTNNNFQLRACRWTGDIVGRTFLGDALVPFSTGDTVEVSFSLLNNGLYSFIWFIITLSVVQVFSKAFFATVERAYPMVKIRA